MRVRPYIAEPPEVALLTETSTEYGRSLLRGILRYSRLHGPWSLYVVPEHLDRFLPPRGSWPQDGILGRTGSLEIVRRIQASGLPFVVSSFYESQLLLHLVAGMNGPVSPVPSTDTHSLSTATVRLAWNPSASTGQLPYRRNHRSPIMVCVIEYRLMDVPVAKRIYCLKSPRDVRGRSAGCILLPA